MSDVAGAMALIPSKGDSMQEHQQRVSGTVVNANERGFQFSGAESWLNWSKYATEPRTLPAPGESIVAMLDSAGFVRSVLRAEGVKPEVARSSVKSEPVAVNRTPDKLFRLQCFNAANEYFRGGGALQYNADDVFALAEEIAVWAEGRK